MLIYLQEVIFCKFSAPNLQHWLGCASWAKLFPEATVYVAPAAEGECLIEKLDLNHKSRAKVLEEKGSLFDGQLLYSLLKGENDLITYLFFTIILCSNFSILICAIKSRVLTRLV